VLKNAPPFNEKLLDWFVHSDCSLKHDRLQYSDDIHFFYISISIIQDRAAGEVVTLNFLILEVCALTQNLQYPIENDARDQQKFVFHVTLVRRLFVGFTRFIFHLIAEQEISGVENLPPEGPVVMASNHLTNFDVFPIQFCLSRPLFFMAKAELHKNWFMDAFLRQLGAFPVKRGERDEWALNHARKVLDQGQVFGRPHCRFVHDIDLMLAGGYFMVGFFHRDADLLENLHDPFPHPFPRIGRGCVKIFALVG